MKTNPQRIAPPPIDADEREITYDLVEEDEHLVEPGIRDYDARFYLYD